MNKNYQELKVLTSKEPSLCIDKTGHSTLYFYKVNNHYVVKEEGLKISRHGIPESTLSFWVVRLEEYNKIIKLKTGTIRLNNKHYSFIPHNEDGFAHINEYGSEYYLDGLKVDKKEYNMFKKRQSLKAKVERL